MTGLIIKISEVFLVGMVDDLLKADKGGDEAKCYEILKEISEVTAAACQGEEVDD